MAEELVIRIQTGEGGRQGTPGSGAGSGAAVGFGASALARGFDDSLPKSVAGIGEKKLERLIPKEELLSNRFLGIANHSLKRRGMFSAQYNIQGAFSPDESPEDVGTLSPPIHHEDIDVSSFYGSRLHQAGQHIRHHAVKNKKAGAALGWRIAGGFISDAQYRSGDSYKNAQLNNAMKATSYATAIAMSGPMAPLVAKGILVNELSNAIQSNRNYNWDRKMETVAINNSKAVAGDISYGRNRGVGR